MSEFKDRVEIYADGGAIGNPGPGCYGVVLLHEGRRKEPSGGFRLTTNNLWSRWPPLPARLEVRGGRIDEGWAESWRGGGWRKKDKKKALNVDLWERLSNTISRHAVAVRWVKGHAGVSENERYGELTGREARRGDIAPDEAYEKERSSSP